MTSIKQMGAPAPMTHAKRFTEELCQAFDGPNAAKTMARALDTALETCRAYRKRHRAANLDMAIELAARDDRALAALMARIDEARERNAALHVEIKQVTNAGLGLGIGQGRGRVGAGSSAGRAGEGNGHQVVASGQDAARQRGVARRVVGGGERAAEATHAVIEDFGDPAETLKGSWVCEQPWEPRRGRKVS